MAYFLLVEIPYEGVAVTRFETLKEAELAYRQSKKDTIPDANPFSVEAIYTGVALIEGEILAEYGQSILRW